MTVIRVGTEADIGYHQQLFAVSVLEGRDSLRHEVVVSRSAGTVRRLDAFIGNAEEQAGADSELEIAAQPADRLRVLLSYAFNDSELDRFSRVDAQTGRLVDLSGNTPPYAPKRLANLWVNRSFRSGLAVGAGARFIGEQYFNADNAFEVDEALVWNGSVTYDVEAWRFRLHLKNLTDEDYAIGSFGSNSVVPAEPFSAEAGVEYRF